MGLQDFNPGNLENPQNHGSDNGSQIEIVMKYEELTHKIIGYAMRVHSALGNGFQEVIYQRALEIEMANSGISFSREYEMPVRSQKP